MSEHDVAAWFAGKSFEELGAIEHGAHLLFPEALRKKGTKGEEVHERVMVRVPTELDRSLARLDCIDLLNEQRKGKTRVETVEQARNAIGAEVFEDWDTYAIVSRCTFEVAPPHPRFMLLGLLMGSWPRSSVYDLYERIDFLTNLIDPRMGDLTEEQLWSAVAAIAKVRNLSPLGAMRGETQRAFMVRMAELLWSSRTQLSSSPSIETSTQAA